MTNLTTSRVTFGRTSASIPGTSTSQRQENTPLQETTNKERATRRFEVELKNLKDQGNHSDSKPVASSSMNSARKLSSSSDQLSENEQYAKALLIAVREEIYKKGDKSSNKLRATSSGEDKDQWKKRENERLSKAHAEFQRIQAQLRSGTNGPYFLAIQKIIQATIEAKGHNCSDLTHSGIGILDAASIKDTRIVGFTDLDHGVILIGKIPPSGLPLDMEKWPSHLAICDPWANIACPAKEFISAFREKMQKWESDGKKIRDVAKKVWANPVYPDLEKKLRGRRDVYAPLVGKELKDKDGRTPLMAMVYAGTVDDVQILLKAGADIEAKDSQGLTPLLVATYKGNTEMLDVLLKTGANMEAKDDKGRTALMIAVEMAASNSDTSRKIGLQILKVLLAANAQGVSANAQGVIAPG